ncbi:MAG: hypothetical protein ABI553_10560 [Chloroflexota bacterium]
MAEEHTTAELDRAIVWFLSDRADAVRTETLPGSEMVLQISAQAHARRRIGSPSRSDRRPLGRPLLLVGVLLSVVVGTGLVVSAGARHPDGSAAPASPASSVPRVVGAAVPGTFTLTSPMTTTRRNPTATRLRDGRVLVAGGYLAEGTSEIFDPATGTFAKSGDLTFPRDGHSATLLADGRVLVSGGLDLVPAEVWDPATGAFTMVGTPSVHRMSGRTTIQPDGRVLFWGGAFDDGSGSPLPTIAAEIWDPITGLFSISSIAPPATPPTSIPGVRVTLGDGRVLVIDASQARIWDPVTQALTATGSVIEHRINPTATLLADGRVLVAGGTSQQQEDHLRMVAEIWDPATGSFAPTAMTAIQRVDHAAVLLADGRVLLVGNWRRNDDPPSAEIFELGR